MKFAKWVFIIGGVFGLLAIIPLYFNEKQIAPGLKYPEFYYGFIGINILWQVLYIYISQNLLRFRPIILFAFFVKILGVVSISYLVLIERTATWWYGIISTDLILAILFLAAYRITGRLLEKPSST